MNSLDLEGFFLFSSFVLGVGFCVFSFSVCVCMYFVIDAVPMAANSSCHIFW